MSERTMRRLFLTTVVICALTLGLLAVGLTRQSRMTCEAANRAIAAQLKSWEFTEQTVKSGWAKKPPTPDERKQTNRFFAGVKAPLQPVRC